MSRRDNDRPDLTEWTLPDLLALRAPDDSAARSAQRAELQSTWTGEIPVLRALSDDRSPDGGVASAAPPATRRGRHSAGDDMAAGPDTDPVVAENAATGSTVRPRGRHSADDAAAEAVENSPVDDTPADDPAGADSTDRDRTDVLAAVGSTSGVPGPRLESDGVRVTVPAGPAVPARSGVRRPVLIALAAVICLFTAGGGTAAALGKTVTITVDGQQREVSTLSTDVAGALSSAGLAVGEHDSLAPSPDASIRDGSKISLDHGRQLTVVIDGKEQQIWTTARTVDAALAELGDADTRLRLSADRSRPIPLQGMAVRGATLRTVQLTDAGRKASVTTSVATVRELLAERKVRLSSHDSVSPTEATTLTDGLKVTVTRRAIARSIDRRSLPQPPDRTITDPEVERHTTTVTKGRTGIERLVYETVTTNGKAGPERLVSRSTVRTPEATTTHVGAAITKSSDGWNVPWDQLAECESTGTWDINTGNGTYGGIQFMTSTWLQYGGDQYAPRADLATKDQQIAIGEKLYAAEGLAPWACARILGWGFDKYTGGW